MNVEHIQSPEPAEQEPNEPSQEDLEMLRMMIGKVGVDVATSVLHLMSGRDLSPTSVPSSTTYRNTMRSSLAGPDAAKTTNPETPKPDIGRTERDDTMSMVDQEVVYFTPAPIFVRNSVGDPEVIVRPVPPPSKESMERFHANFGNEEDWIRESSQFENESSDDASTASGS